MTNANETKTPTMAELVAAHRAVSAAHRAGTTRKLAKTTANALMAGGLLATCGSDETMAAEVVSKLRAIVRQGETLAERHARLAAASSCGHNISRLWPLDCDETTESFRCNRCGAVTTIPIHPASPSALAVIAEQILTTLP